MACRLHLGELVLAHRMMVWIRIVTLLHVSLVWAGDLHPVDVFNDHLLVMRWHVALCVDIWMRISFFHLLIWILCFLNILDRRSLFSLHIEGRLADWLASTVQLDVGCLGWWLGQLRFWLGSHCHWLVMSSTVLIDLNLTLVASSFHVCLLTLTRVSSVVRCHRPLLLDSELLFRAKVTLAHVVWIVSNHALLVDWVSDCLWSTDSMSVCISALLVFLSILTYAIGLFLGWELTLLRIWRSVMGNWLLVLGLGLHLLALNGLACSLGRVLLLLRMLCLWVGRNFVCDASSVNALVLGHDLLESLVIEVTAALLLRRLVNRVHCWSASRVSGLKSLSFCVPRAWYLWLLHLLLMLLLRKSENNFVDDLVSRLCIGMGLRLLWLYLNRLALLLLVLNVSTMRFVVGSAALSQHHTAGIDWSVALLGHLTVEMTANSNLIPASSGLRNLFAILTWSDVAAEHGLLLLMLISISDLSRSIWSRRAVSVSSDTVASTLYWLLSLCLSSRKAIAVVLSAVCCIDESLAFLSLWLCLDMHELGSGGLLDRWLNEFLVLCLIDSTHSSSCCVWLCSRTAALVHHVATWCLLLLTLE